MNDAFKSSRPSKRVILEGVPGSGKSSAVQALAAHYKTQGYRVKIMQEKPDENLLEQYLNNKPALAALFQFHMATERRVAMRDARAEVEANTNTIVIIDRSIAGDWAFEKHLRALGWIPESLHPAYRSISGVKSDESIAVHYPPGLVDVVYLSVTPATAIRRVTMRGYQAEIDSYDEKYMESLQSAYESVLAECGPVVHTLDWNADVEMEEDEKGGKKRLPLSAVASIVDLLKY